MLTTLAIINMAVAATLINDTADASTLQQEPTAIVTTIDTENQTPDYISWSDE